MIIIVTAIDLVFNGSDIERRTLYIYKVHHSVLSTGLGSVLVAFLLLVTQDTQCPKLREESLFSSQVVELSVHNWLALRQDITWQRDNSS